MPGHTSGSRQTWQSGFAVLCAGQFLGHQTALAFSALIPLLSPVWALSAGQAGLILGIFQLGLLISHVGVGFALDRFPGKPIMAGSALLVGLGDILFALGARDFTSGFLLRGLVGFLLGGLYLPALKQIAQTVPVERRGRATGFYLAMLVAAQAAPLAYVGLLAPRLGWQPILLGIGVAEMLGGLLLAALVPTAASPRTWRAHGQRYVGDVLRNRPARRIILAYTGHNWELLGMWGWMAPFMVALLTLQGATDRSALAWGGFLSAAVIGIGGFLGAIAGGHLSGRVGRPRAATMLLTASLPCSVAFGWLLGAPLAIAAATGFIYSFTALADSPSYSTGLMEAVPAESLGGALSLMMLAGFGATILAPPAFGALLDVGRLAGWPAATQWGAAYSVLAVGPLAGIAALRPLWSEQRRGRRALPQRRDTLADR